MPDNENTKYIKIQRKKYFGYIMNVMVNMKTI